MLVENGSPLQTEGVPFLIDEGPLTVGDARLRRRIDGATDAVPLEALGPSNVRL
jgi:hypothetical protein